MRLKHHFQISSVLLAVLVLCTLLSSTAQVSALGTHANQAGAPTSVNANVYLTNALLQPLFQNDLNTQLPQAMSQAIASMVGQLSQQDQGWATQMANALLQPSAVLLNVVPQANGLLAIFNVSLYPGDPQVTTTSLVIGFRVLDASTIQVTSLPTADGQQSLLSGPLTTFHLSIGTLNTIATTPNCGDSDLKINLQFPLALGQGQPKTTLVSGFHSVPQLAVSGTGPVQRSAVTPSPTAYIELPAASLAQVGSSIGSLDIGSNFTATNIRLGVQGGNLVLTTDIQWNGFGFGTAVSNVAPGVLNGNLVGHVQNTVLQLINGLIAFPLNNYNQQIEQAVNAKLNGALANKFTVTQAAIGSNPHMPCVTATSLLLGGTISLN
jgi:hypothetical protein